MKRHVFVIACSPRSGSTLLQRLLMTHPDLFMWGEGRHLLPGLLQLHKDYVASVGHPIFSQSRNALCKDGPIKGWYPNLIPRVPIDSFIADCMNGLFGQRKDCKYWGCKFVLITVVQVVQLRRIFPDAGFIFLTRPWAEVRKSVEECRNWWPRLSTSDIHEHWHSMVKFFREPGFDALSVTYENLCNNSGATTTRIEKHLEMESGSLDMSVFEHKVRGIV